MCHFFQWGFDKILDSHSDYGGLASPVMLFYEEGLLSQLKLFNSANNHLLPMTFNKIKVYGGGISWGYCCLEYLT